MGFCNGFGPSGGTTYKIDIPAQRKTVVSQDVEFDEDVISSSSKVSPSVIEESEEVTIPKADSKVRAESES